MSSATALHRRSDRAHPARAATPSSRLVSARRLAGQLLCVVVLIGLWQALVASGTVSSDTLARPTAVARSLGHLVRTSALWSTVGDTAHTWIIGLLISVVVAIPVGLVLGASDLLYRMFRVAIDFLRTIPPVVLIPLALLLYGATEKMVLVLVLFGAIWPMMLQTMYGFHQVDPVARDVARSYRLRRRDVVRSLVLPSAAPFIATGIRIAATISLLLVIGAELLGGAPGIGSEIALAQQGHDVARMYAFVIVAAVLGVVLNLAMINAERRLLSWHPAHRARNAR
ncbi:MAG: ABC transporter permease [Jatrophihabitans sp.]